LETVAQRRASGEQLDVLEGMCQALRGWRKAPKPACWETLAPTFLNNPEPQVRQRAAELGAVFGDGRALDELRRVALDDSADPTARRSALQSLIDSQSPG